MFSALCGGTGYLIWAGCLVHPASVLIVLLRLGLVRHAVGLVHGCYIVHQRDGLHGLVNSAADGFSDLSGCRSPGGRKVVSGLKAIKESSVRKQKGNEESARVLTIVFIRVFRCCRFSAEGKYFSQRD